MDPVDAQIVALLQSDATLPVTDIAERVHLSPTPYWRRIHKLTQQRYIRQRVALLDARKLNVSVTVFVGIKTNQHSQAWFDRLSEVVSAIPEVMEFYRMSGDIDYLLRVVVPDIAGYDAVYRKLMGSVDLFDVSSSFAMEQIKFTTALPLDYAV
ncbi:MAG: Lrp/AsnC family transcriptional regulator [Casimicrobiaceae bacterium]